MDNKTVFIKTDKGLVELQSHDSHLSGDIKRVLLLIDDRSTAEDLFKRAAPSLRAQFPQMLKELVEGEFIRDPAAKATKIVKPAKSQDVAEDLDFTRAVRLPTAADLAAEAQALRLKKETDAQLRVEQEKLAKQELEAGRTRAEQEAAAAKAQLQEVTAQAAAQVKAHAEAGVQAKRMADAAREQAEQDALQARAEAAAARLQAQQEAQQAKTEAKAAAEAERVAARQLAEQAKAEAAAERLAAQQEAAQARAEAEAARIQAAQIAEQAKAAAESARHQAEQDAARARADLEAAKQQMEFEAQARAQAEIKAQQEAMQAKAEVEAARLKAEQEAQQARAEAQAAAQAARVQAEQETARLKAEAEAARQQAQQEAAQAKADAEAARAQAAQAAEKMKAEADAARILAAQEAARAKAEARAEAEAARLEAAQEAARIKAETEAARKLAAEESARLKAEAEAAREQAAQEAEKMRAEMAAVQAKAAAQAQALAAAEAQARQAAEAARQKAEQEAAQARALAEVVRSQAEQESARVQQAAEAARRLAQEEAERVKAEAEAARQKAEQEAEAVRLEMLAAQARADFEARARAEAERKAQQEAEAKSLQEAELARIKAAQEAVKAEAKARALAEAKARQEAEEARLHAVAEAKAKQQAEEARIKAERELARLSEASKGKHEAAVSARSMIATVLFFDVVGYTKQSVTKQIQLKDQFNSLVSRFIQHLDESQRLILDTGDGAALGFLQHPEDALEVAMQFRSAVTANKHRDYPELNVRIGIHLGPVNVVKDMNGQSNMVGDGINDAQRIMSFASTDCIYISRSYFDVVSRLSADYANLFKYRGVKLDKHGREHQVYEVSDGLADEDMSLRAIEPPHSGSPAADFQPIVLGELSQVPSSSFGAVTQKVAALKPPTTVVQPPAPVAEKSPAEIAAEAQAAAQLRAQQQAEEIRLKAEQEEAQRKIDEAAKAMEKEQAKAWADAEKRAKQAQQASKREFAHAAPAVVEAAPIPAMQNKPRRKAMPLGKMLAALGGVMLLLLLSLPYLWPLHGYIAPLQEKISAQLNHQPVHIGKLSAALFPLPSLELQDFSVGANQELQASRAVLHFGVGALFSSTKPISQVEVHDLVLSGAGFEQSVGWLQNAAANTAYPVAQIQFHQARVNGELAVPALSGRLDFSAGALGKAVLHSEDDKVKVEIDAHASPAKIMVTLKQSSLPFLSTLALNDLTASGEIGAHDIHFSEFDSGLYGGQITGNAKLSWHKGWQLQGRMNAKAFDLEKILPGSRLSGEMEGEARFNFNSNKLVKLGDASNLEGTFVVKNGVVTGMDIIETARLGSTQQGGRTHFDTLSGVLQMERDAPRFSQLRLSTGVMAANGTLDVSANRQLSGHLAVELKVRSGGIPLSINGTVNEPLIKIGR